MDELMLQNGTDIVVALHNDTDLTAPMPFERNTLLLDTWVSETNCVDDIDETFTSLCEDAALFLIREPNHGNDEYAIRVETDTQMVLGYIPRIYSPILARLMDTGKLLYATVSMKDIVDEYYKVVISVYLKE